MKNIISHNTSNGFEHWVYVILGMAGLLSILLAVASFTNFVQGRYQALAEWSGGKPRSHMTAWSYVKSGQWRADARTLGAMATYLLEREPDLQVAKINAGLIRVQSVGSTAVPGQSNAGPNV